MHRLILGFEDRSSMLEFAESTFGKGLSIYRADLLDQEIDGDLNHTYVIRQTGAKPPVFSVWAG